MAYYRRNDRKIDTLRKRNINLSNIIIKELNNYGDTKIIEKCFDDIKNNQIQIDYLIKRNCLRIYAISAKLKMDAIYE